MGIVQGGLLGALTAYHFTIHKNAKGEHYFIYRNKHGNTEPICWSEGYSSKQACKDAIAKVQTGAATAAIDDLS